MTVKRKNPPVVFTPVGPGNWEAQEVEEDVFEVEEVTEPEGVYISHSEYGLMHAQQGSFILTNQHGVQHIVHPDDLEEHYE